MQPEATRPASLRGIGVAAAVAAALVWSQYSSDVIRAVSPDRFFGGFAYARAALASTSDIVVMLGLLCLFGLLRLRDAVGLAGLNAPIIRPLVASCMIFAPVVILCVFLAPITNQLSMSDIAWLGVGGPFTEEIIYRGLAVGALMQLAGWRFVPAVLAPAIIFGVAHAAQGDSYADSASIAAITAVGGLLFGWLYVRWGFNLWPAIFAHVGMNTLWIVFAFGETAVGGWFGNIVRLVLIAMLVLSAIRFAPRKNTTKALKGLRH